MRARQLILISAAAVLVDRAAQSAGHACAGVIFHARAFVQEWCAALRFNDGFALSANAGMPLLNGLVAVAASLGLGLYAWKRRAELSAHQFVPLCAMSLAGLNNAYSRFAYGAVVDYLPFFGWFHFNISDAVITAAAAWYVVATLRTGQTRRRIGHPEHGEGSSNNR